MPSASSSSSRSGIGARCIADPPNGEPLSGGLGRHLLVEILRGEIRSGPTISYGPDKHKGANVTFLAKVEKGRWVTVDPNLIY